jgi:anti-sigma B factor antagonist
MSAAPQTSQPGLTIRVASDGDDHWLALYGELDLATIPVVEGEIASAVKHGARTLIVDLSGVHFIDSSGVHLILDVQQSCRQNGHQLLLIRGPAEVQRVFELTDIESLLTFVD